ncbi:MAG: HAD-IA family hydrolase [Candidatus Aenigmatarchaeota archaeon]|nr:MAG: HAD-IA family hydrolase [Candidatus Aenigmarchaeota archaeon]
MHTIRAVIFDFDGTFAPQTNRLHFLSFRTAFRKFGYDMQESDLVDLFGVPQDQIIRTLLPTADDKTVKRISDFKMREYMKLISKESIPHENVRTIEALKKRGFKVAISSGSYLGPVKRMVPMHLIDDIVTAEDIHRPKPDPEILLKTAKDMRIRPDQCAYVGDSWRDKGAADAAEMLFIGVLADLTSKGLLASNPEMLVGSIPELLKLFVKAPQEVAI